VQLTTTQEWVVVVHCVSKNAPTLASCSFDKHGLILIIFGKQHQHSFTNDMHIQLSLSLHFYLLYLILNSYDGNDAFWRHSMLMKQSTLSGGNTGFYLSTSVSSKQSDWPGNPVDYRILRLMEVVSTVPATWCSASMTHGQAYHKTSKQLANGESGYIYLMLMHSDLLFLCCMYGLQTVCKPFTHKP